MLKGDTVKLPEGERTAFIFAMRDDLFLPAPLLNPPAVWPYHTGSAYKFYGEGELCTCRKVLSEITHKIFRSR